MPNSGPPSVVRSSFVLELAGGEDRPTYLGLATTAQGPFALAGPAVAAVLAEWSGLQAVFAVAGLLSGGAAAIYVVKVEEPRGRRKQDGQDGTVV